MLRHALRLRAAAPAGRFSRHSGTVASPATDNAPVLGWMGRPETDANRPNEEFIPAVSYTHLTLPTILRV